MEDPTISYPFGAMDIQAPAYAAAIELTIKNQKTLVNVAELSGDLTLTAVAADDLNPGAEVIVKLQSDATARDTTLSTGFSGVTVAGVISKTKYVTFVYDGTSFVNTSLMQVD